MKLFNWLRPDPVIHTEIKYVVDPQIGRRQVKQIREKIDTTKYRIGDSLESVAYRQGQMDLIDFIERSILGGKL